MMPQICAAIKDMKLLAFTYEGYARIVEPHAYGCDTKGNDIVRVYQVGGGSESGNSIGWKLFLISRMQGLQVQDQQFDGARAGYRQGDSAMQSIYCQL